MIKPVRQTLFVILLFTLVISESLISSLSGMYQSFFSFLIGVIFYFSVFAPRFLNVVFIFLLGLLSDYFLQAPLGFNAFLFVLVHFLAYFNRIVISKMPFFMQWLTYSFVCGIVFLTALVMIYIAYGFIAGILPLLTKYVMLIIFYPFISYISGYILNKSGYQE